MIGKERASGSYHLSAYYLAKTISELPILFILPSLYIVIVYWAAGLNSVASFFGSWFVLILNCFVGQVGLSVGLSVFLYTCMYVHICACLSACLIVTSVECV